MMKSMTGYGRGQALVGAVGLSVEMKTVNHRYADISVRAPRFLLAQENQVKKQVSATLKRGKIDIYINQVGGDELTVKPVVHQQLAAAYIEAFQQLREVGAEGEVSLALLAAQPEVLTLQETGLAQEDLIDCLQQALASAVQQVFDMRIAEGRAMEVDIQERLSQLKANLQVIEQQALKVPVEWQRKLGERLTRLQGVEVDPQRLAQEVAIVADRCDISEEIVRFYSHLQQFEQLLAQNEPVGRQLDFLVQELNREANTIGSKSNDATLTRYVVSLKSVLEKIREQVQNIE